MTECCKKKCPKYYEREQTKEERKEYWKISFLWLFKGKEIQEVLAYFLSLFTLITPLSNSFDQRKGDAKAKDISKID
jgi:hypothetical protein